MYKYFKGFGAFLIVWTVLLGVKVEAHPVAFAGSYSIMTWNNKDSSEWMFVHSITSRYSLAARYTRMDTKDGERTFYLPEMSFLLKRWNELDSQANIYLTLGHGVEKEESTFKNTTAATLEADWESRKYYVSFKEDVLVSYKDKSKSMFQTRVRAGFAPYLANFNELNAWFILQADHSNKGMDEVTLTPLVRLFYRNILTEMGASSRGDLQFNFMVHF
ncbi:MAG: hypothetical protein K2Q18_03610 [Bdellovibrionales bacterium]|nr:hypothetical protein [Bdellovibrionales bacterium]